jgi:hypothetical protein
MTEILHAKGRRQFPGSIATLRGGIGGQVYTVPGSGSTDDRGA